MLTFIKRAFLTLAIPAALLAAGCSIGYTNLHPGENSALYQSLFADIINTYDEPHWLWIRGTISGDLDGNGVVSEELVLATIQQGDAKNPGPIEAAFLVACDVDADGRRTAIARTMLFDQNPIPGAPRPTNDIGIVRENPFTRCRAQMIQNKTTLHETVVAYFWSDSVPSSVWYAGFALEDRALVKNLEAVLWQTSPGFLTANLDRSIGASPYGYQLAFSVAAIPPEIFGKIGSAADAPLWGHVFARDANGQYAQADERFGGHYRQLENSWNQQYLKAIMNDLPDPELAWFEYHMSILNHYLGNRDMALGFFEKAKKHAEDEDLVAAIGRFEQTFTTADAP